MKRMLFEAGPRRGGGDLDLSQTRCGIANLLWPRKPESRPDGLEPPLKDVKRKGKPNDIVFLALLPEWSDCANRMGILMTSPRCWRGCKVMQGDDDREAALEHAREYIRRIRQLDFPRAVQRAAAGLPLGLAFRCADWFNKMNPICHFGKSVSKRSLEDHRRYSVQQISELEMRNSGRMDTQNIWMISDCSGAAIEETLPLSQDQYTAIKINLGNDIAKYADGSSESDSLSRERSLGSG